MKFTPVLFSTQMVQAILAGRKTKTRRIVKPQPTQTFADSNTFNFNFKKHSGFNVPSSDFNEPFIGILDNCPYGKIGDVLWVRETFNIDDKGFVYKANWQQDTAGFKWKPSLFMPKAACRFFLEITSIKVERLHDITERDATAEGVESCIADLKNFGARATGLRLFRNYERKDNSLKNHPCNGFEEPVISFKTLWQSINGKQSWLKNPFVWVIEFKQIDKPQNFC